MMKWQFLLLPAVALVSLLWAGSEAARPNQTYDIRTELGAPSPHLTSKQGTRYPLRQFSIGEPWHKGSFTIVFHGASSSGKSTLCCAMNDVNGRDKVGTKTNKGWTTDVTVYKQNYDRLSKSRCYMLDTPGFGEASEDMQEMVRRGVDNAMSKIHQLRDAYSAPLRRIYLVVDASKKRYQANLRGQLQLLSRAYGKEVLSTLRFVLTKCDRPEDMTDREYFDSFVNTLRELYMNIFEAQLQDSRVLFVAVMGDRACIGQLIEDIQAASTGPELIPNGISIVTEFATAVKRVRDLEDAYFQHVLEPLWELRHTNVKYLPELQQRIERLKELAKDHEATIQKRQDLLQYYEQRSVELREEYMPPCTVSGADLFWVLKAIRELVRGDIADDTYNRLVLYLDTLYPRKDLIPVDLFVPSLFFTIERQIAVPPLERRATREQVKEFWSDVLEAYDQDDKYQGSIAALKRELALLKKNAAETAAIAAKLKAEMDELVALLPLKRKLIKSQQAKLEPRLPGARTEVKELIAEVAP